jgi:hypothetical protein
METFVVHRKAPTSSLLCEVEEWTLHQAHLKAEPQALAIDAFSSTVAALAQVDRLDAWLDPFACRISTREGSHGPGTNWELRARNTQHG